MSGMVHRPALEESVRTASHMSTSSSSSNEHNVHVPGEAKPIASGNGVTLAISLAEPMLFLQGFETSELGNSNTTMLRGSFHLRISKQAKLKAITLSFRGRAETEWPEGKRAILDKVEIIPDM